MCRAGFLNFLPKALLSRGNLQKCALFTSKRKEMIRDAPGMPHLPLLLSVSSCRLIIDKTNGPMRHERGIRMRSHPERSFEQGLKISCPEGGGPPIFDTRCTSQRYLMPDKPLWLTSAASALWDISQSRLPCLSHSCIRKVLQL